MLACSSIFIQCAIRWCWRGLVFSYGALLTCSSIFIRLAILRNIKSYKSIQKRHNYLDPQKNIHKHTSAMNLLPYVVNHALSTSGYCSERSTTRCASEATRSYRRFRNITLTGARTIDVVIERRGSIRPNHWPLHKFRKKTKGNCSWKSRVWISKSFNIILGASPETQSFASQGHSKIELRDSTSQSFSLLFVLVASWSLSASWDLHLAKCTSETLRWANWN